MSPRRPREHQLEDESRRDFARRVPVAWVVRDLQNDYGVDAEVEVFMEGGETTGLLFGVQFKATDDSRLQSALRTSLSVETAAYWRTLPYPILLARYHSPTRTHYVAWLHSRSVELRSEGQKTFTFAWRPRDRWAESTPERLVGQLNAYMAWSRPDTPLPITFYIERGDSDGEHRPDSAQALRLRQALNDIAKLVDFMTGPAPAGGAVVIYSASQVQVNLGDVASTTLHHDEGTMIGHADLALAIAATLAIIGRTDLASRLVIPYANEAGALASLDAASILSHAIVRARRYEDLVRIAEIAWSRRLDSEAIFMVGLVAELDKMGGTQLVAVERLLRQRANRSSEDGDFTREAGERYTLANFLRGLGRYEDALPEYEQAASADPAYLQRPYWLRETAGLLFDLARYEDSVERYQAAVQAGEDVEIYLADAMCRVGRYQDALELMSSRMRRGGDPVAPIWEVWVLALAHIGQVTGISSQTRDPERAREIFEEGADVQDVLRSDALYCEAWFQLGATHDDAGRHRDAFACFLVSAVAEPDALGAWLRAMVTGLLVEELHDVLHLVLGAALHRHGDDVLGPLYGAAALAPPEFGTRLETLRRLAEEANAAAAVRPVFRLPDGEGGYVEFHME